jgi:hypothetical protein
MTTRPKERLKDIDKLRNTRPGWSMVNSPALNLAVMAQCVPGQTALSADDLKRIAGHLLWHQEADGSWSWSSVPAANRPPPYFESDEIATLLAAMALDPHMPADPQAKSATRDARAKAATWLGDHKPTDTTQAAAYRLLAKVRAGTPAKALQPEIDHFLDRQQKDSGWSQVPDRPSDAYATGQALYMLSLAGVKPDHATIQRGVPGGHPKSRRQLADDPPRPPRHHAGRVHGADCLFRQCLGDAGLDAIGTSQVIRGRILWYRGFKWALVERQARSWTTQKRVTRQLSLWENSVPPPSASCQCDARIRATPPTASAWRFVRRFKRSRTRIEREFG